MLKMKEKKRERMMESVEDEIQKICLRYLYLSLSPSKDLAATWLCSLKNRKLTDNRYPFLNPPSLYYYYCCYFHGTYNTFSSFLSFPSLLLQTFSPIDSLRLRHFLPCFLHIFVPIEIRKYINFSQTNESD